MRRTFHVLFLIYYRENTSRVKRLEDILSRSSTWCEVCQKDLGHYINQKHLSSKGHQAMLRGTHCQVCDKDYPNGIPEKHCQSKQHLKKLESLDDALAPPNQE